MTGEPDPVTAWQLGRYRLGELPPAEAEAIRSALAVSPTLREQMAELERYDEEVLAACPPRVAAATIRARLAETESARARSRGIPRPALAGTAVLVIGLGVAVLGPASRPSEVAVLEPDTTRVKGLLPHLLLFRQTPGGPEALEDGALARTHEVVQLSYQSAGQPYGVIVSVDGRGTVTVHLPVEGPQAARLKPGPVALGSAYRLDDAPAFERFHFVTSPRPFGVAVVTEAARAHAMGGAAGREALLSLPAGLQQSSFTLRKEEAP